MSILDKAGAPARRGPAAGCKAWRLAGSGLLALAALAGCGGEGADPRPPVAAAAPLQAASREGGVAALGMALAEARLRSSGARGPGTGAATPTTDKAADASAAASASSAAVDAIDAADQLMGFAEASYPQFFPSHRTTRQAGEWLYRYYPESGIYLGVRQGQVHVLGGAFGAEPLAVGALESFITPRAPAASGACAVGSPTHGLFVTPAPALGRNAALALLGCSTTIARARWQQTTGPAVVFVADRTQAISFDPPAAGDYGFRVDFTDALGVARSESVALRVADGALPATRLTLRAAHAVRMGGKASVRAWARLAEGDEVESIEWQQVEGPAVTLDTRERELAVFTAPAQVDRDTVIRLRATLRTRQGTVDHDEATVLVERFVQAAAGDTYALWAGEHIPRLYPFLADGRHAANLLRCTYDPGQKDWGPDYNLCALRELPFLAQETGDIPTVEQVMQRVLVSHDWLGRNFETFLRRHDGRGDFRRMLRSVTAVILSTHVRPSFYYAGTGAIYLDADEFWLTPEERDSVNEAPDYRSDFGNALQFATLWRYVEGKRNVLAFVDPQPRQLQPESRLLDAAGWLLYHELAHALDFMPPSAYAALRNGDSVWGNIYPRYSQQALGSDTVPALYPLTSAELSRLGDVQFRGAEPTEDEKAYTPEQVAAWFAADLAVDDYNYSTRREDLAMTVESFLMSHRLGMLRDMAFTPPRQSSDTGSTLIVRWGQRGRIGEPALRPRLKDFLRNVVPWVDVGEVDRLAPPLAMRIGDSWTANLDLTPPTGAATSRKRLLGAPPTAADRARERHEWRHMNHHRHLAARPLPVAPGAQGLDAAQQLRRGRP